MKTIPLLLALGVLTAPAPAQGARSEAEPSTTQGSRFDDWLEDPERVKANWAFRMTPEEYRAALRATGMQKALDGGLVDVAPPGGTLPEAMSSWTLAGPRGAFGSTNEWRNGRVSDVQFHQSGATTYIYAGACQGGLWVSTTATLGTWTPIGDTLPNPSVGAISVRPDNRNAIYVGTGDQARYGGSGLYLTTNHGLTWGLMNLPVSPSAFYRIHHRTSDGQIVLAATDQALVRTTNFGANWSATLWGDVTDLLAHPTQPDTFYATVRADGVYKSTTGGLTWSKLSDPDLPAATDFGRSSIALCQSFPETVAMLVADHQAGSGSVKGVYRTIDGGLTWSNVTSNLPGNWATNAEGSHAQSIAVHPTNPNTIYAAMRGLCVTTNAGASWMVDETAHGVDFIHADITEVRFDPLTGNNALWICNDGGIYRHTVSTQTTIHVIGGTTNGLAICEIDFMDADRGMRVIGLQDNGILRSTNSGGSWTALQNADGGVVEITDPVASEFWYLHGFWCPPFPTWRMFRRTLAGGNEDMQHPGAWNPRPFRDPFGNKVYTTDAGSIVSLPVDATPGTAWATEYSGGFGQNSAFGVRRIAGSRADGRTLYVAYWKSMNAENVRDVTVLRPNGASWIVNHTEDLVTGSSEVAKITTSTEWPGEAWAGIRGPTGTPKIFHTTDYGVSWTDITNGLESVTEVMSIVNTPFDPLTLYAATNIGVFRSVDAGASWQAFQSGLPIARSSELIFVANDSGGNVHKLVLSTDGRAVWTRDITSSPIYYVDKKYTGATTNGSFEYPYKTVASAEAIAPSGSILAVRTDTYLEPQTITKNVKLVTWAGNTVIR